MLKITPRHIALGTLAGLAAANAANVQFFYNNVGYDIGKPMSVIVKSDASLDGATFEVSAEGGAPKTGTLSKGSNPDNWLNDGTKFYVANLEDIKEAGSYTLQVTVDGQPFKSDAFVVAENALAANTLKSVMDYFYKDRADKDPIVGWDKELGVYGSGTKRDVHGGWYDASGDVSKYLSHLSYANYLNPQQIPLTVWALAFASEKMPKTLAANPSTATAIEESIYGADFLVRMLDDQGFFYMTVFDVWGNPTASRELCAFSGSDGVKSADYQTAFREGGGMAIAALARASTLGKNGDYTSEQYLDAAKKAFAHLQSKQTMDGSCAYCDDGKENIIDDYTALMAATELYAATQDTAYLTQARKRAKHLEGRLSNDGYFWSDDAKTRPFWHASDAGLPLVALGRYAEIESEQKEGSGTLDEEFIWDCLDCIGCGCINNLLVNAKDAIEKHLKWLVSVTNEVDNPFGYARQTAKTQGAIKNTFFIPHDNESKYWWQGEDARIASLSAAALYAAKILGIPNDSDVNKYAIDQLDWILGKNPYGVCMMYKKGKKNPKIYDGQSKYDATLEGGIANGISGKNTDGSGIAWDSDGVGAVGFDSDMESWQNWRWIEQWLPHSTWYFMAIASLYDEKTTEIKDETTSLPSVAKASFGARLQNRSLTISLQSANARQLSIVSIDGRQVMKQNLTQPTTTLDLSHFQSGIYLLKVQGLGIQKIFVK